MAAALFGKGIPIKSRSWVWKYFTISPEDTSIAICNTCKLKVSRGNKEKKSKSFNTTNMLCHINTKHKEIASKELKLNEEENKRKAESEKNVFKKIKSTEASCSKQSQQTLFETLARKKPWDINDHRSKLINNYIAEMIAVDIQPFSIVEDIGFQRLLNHICPNYCIPSRKYIKNTVFQNIYDKVRQNIQKEINDASYISFTTDGWASTNGKCSFLSLTAHWLTNKFHQKSAVLRVCQFNVSHTAKNICEAIQSSMNDFFIPASKVHLVARDNAANMTAGIREAGYNSLPCFLHTLQLVLNDTVFAQIYIKKISTTCKNIVTHFNHSPSSFEAYRKYQTQYQVPQNRFKQDIATRWNSQYFMFERIFEQKRALIPFCCDNDNSKLKSLENNEWIILEKLQQFLKMFNDITNLLSEREAIASAIIPTVQVIQTMLIQAEKSPLFFGLGTILKECKNSANERFEKYLNDKNLILATFLDPRYKNNFFPTEVADSYLENIIKWLVDCSKSFQQNDHIEFQPEVSSSSSTANLDFDFSKCFENFIKNKNTLIENTSISEVLQETESKHYIKLKNEVLMYLSQDIIMQQDSPLVWWGANRNNFKQLAPIAQKYLSCPPSSVESERLFSCGGQIYSPRRSRLAPETGEMLMFLHYNIRIHNFKY